MEELLARSARASEGAEIFSASNRSTQASFEANRLKQVQTKESAGTALRLIKKGRIGFAATSRTDGQRELLDMALEMAPFGAEAKFEFPDPQSYSKLSVFDANVALVTEEAMVELGKSMIDQIRAMEPELLCDASVNRSVYEITIANSRGGNASYQKSVFSISIEGVLVRGTDMLFVGDYERSCHPLATADKVVQATLEQLRRAKDIAQSPTARLPVIFTPMGVASALIAPLVSAFNGRTVLRGASPVGHRRGEQVFAPGLSIWDDPTIPFRPASSICDDEGIPTQRTALVEKGVVMNFLYDLQTAGEAKTKSTGSASRSVGSLPGPSTSALIIDEGKVSFVDLLADIKEGLVIEELMGATQGNTLGGDFSGNVLLGYKVENGRIVGRVKNTMVSGNVYELLKEGIAIGNDSRWLGGSIRTPSIFCPSVAVAAK
ncbi:MAG: TldD/PmbA family protein [Dehalococcoidia bacterium]|nr:TldD/PmbA family protein [Dehalococcoidia bacterium]